LAKFLAWPPTAQEAKMAQGQGLLLLLRRLVAEYE
jgi:hypothetical protein